MAKFPDAIDKYLACQSQKKIKFIHLKFNGFPDIGSISLFLFPVDADSFVDGYGFGRFIIKRMEGDQRKRYADNPWSDTLFFDPFIESQTASLICDVYEPQLKKNIPAVQWNIAQKAEVIWNQTGYTDTV